MCVGVTKFWVPFMEDHNILSTFYGGITKSILAYFLLHPWKREVNFTLFMLEHVQS